MNIKPKRLAYLAGLIDGDGSVNIRYNAVAGYQLTIAVYNTHRPLMKFLVQQFGGSFRKLPTEGNRKQRYQWYTTSKEISTQVAKHLVLKSKQGSSIILFHSISGINPDGREVCMNDIKLANNEHIPVTKKHKSSILTTTDKNDFAYLAGLFDAEGTITIHSKKFGNGKYSSVIRLSNTDQRIMDWISSRFFGYNAINRKKDNKDEGVWYFSSVKGNAGRILREKFTLALLPYLVIKKERAVLVLHYMRNNKMMNDSQKYELYKKVSKLNERGKSVEAIRQTHNNTMCEDMVQPY